MTTQTDERRQRVTPDVALLLSLGFIAFLIQVLANALVDYGYFRDELYYIACAEHLDTGYVDQPPFSIYLLALSRMLFGDLLVALRLLPAMAAGANVVIVGMIARELGGGRFAQVLTAVAVLLSPIYLAMFSIFSMNSFDILIWSLAAYVLVRMLRVTQRQVILSDRRQSIFRVEGVERTPPT
jgi:dolichyl-phosphate-mannose--protein O-mannosyl transferase